MKRDNPINILHKIQWLSGILFLTLVFCLSADGHQIPYIEEAVATTTVEVTLPPELKRICSCESTGSPTLEPLQFKNGLTVQRKNYDKYGQHWSSDWGACQINDYWWSDEASKLGLDYKNSKNDNYRMALYIYNKLGNEPWSWSSGCHSK